jgi:D-alanyl-D-alanine carboxypeptidase
VSAFSSAAVAAASFVSLLASVAGTAAPVAEPSLEERLASVIRAGTPGVLVRVDDGARHVTAVRGVAVLSPRIRLRGDDRFRAGSITKTFVAVVALQLVAEKRLRLEDTVERRLPGLVPGGERITVRDLLGHTSGLADYTATPGFLARTQREPARRWTPRELIGLAVGRGPAGPVGRFAYSSTNYVVLGSIVERAAGKPLADVLRRRIIAPLGLRGTSYVSGAAGGRHVHGYTPSQHDGVVGSIAAARDRGADGASWAGAAGALVSTAPDLSRFFGALLQGRLLPPRLLALMRPTPGARYGLGLAAFRTPCGTAIGHTGNLLGVVSAAWNSTDGRRRVVAMSNSYPLTPEADTAVRRLLETAFCGPR